MFICPWKGRQTDHKPAGNIFLSQCKGLSFHIYWWRQWMKANNLLLLKFSDPFWMLYLLDLSAVVDIADYPTYYTHLVSRAAFIFLCLFLILPVSLTTPFFFFFFFFMIPSYLWDALKWECAKGHSLWKSSVLFPFYFTQSPKFKSHL